MPANQNLFTDMASVGFPGTNISGSARGYGDARDTDWYRFQAASSDTLVASVTAQHAVAVSIHQLSATGTCPSTLLTTSSVSTRCQSTSATIAAVAGTWYGVKITPSPVSTTGGAAVGGSSYKYVGSITLGGPPSNDNCSTPTSIGAAGNSPAGVNGSNSFAALDGSPTGCTENVDKDVWYSFQPNSSGWWDISTCNGTTQDTIVEVYDACGGLLVGCNDDSVGCGSGTQSKAVVNLLSTISYRIRVASKGFPAAGGTFNLLVAPSVVGACCLTGGICQEVPAAACSSLGGSFNGDGSNCSSELGTSTTYDGSSGLPAPVPDNLPAGVTVSQSISGTGTIIGDLDVQFTFSPAHTWYSDVNMTLRHVASNTIVTLMNGDGNNANIAGPYTFDDSAAGTFDSAAALAGDTNIPSGSYRPDGLLSAFNGMSLDSIWELKVWDDTGSDTGTLASWSIIATQGLPPCGACCNTGVCTGDTAPLACTTGGGTHQGPGTDCDPDPCAVGACCQPEGGCIETTLGLCESGGGTYRGANSFCVSVDPPCPPTGRCCPPSGAPCSMATEANCSAPGYSWDETQTCGTPCETEACCFADGSCQVLTNAGCLSLSGVPQTGTPTCGAITYAPDLTCTDGFIDISGIPGTAIPAVGDEGSVLLTFPPGFTLNYFGVSRSAIRVHANGFVHFSSFTGSAFNAAAFPAATPSGLHAMIAPLWRDLNMSLGGSIHAIILGAVPNRLLVIQWNDAHRYNVPVGSSNTFEVIISEESGCISFRYLSIDPLSGTSGDPSFYTVGLEDDTSSAGVNVSTPIANNSCVVFVRNGQTCPQPEARAVSA
ncbi:MAG: hypothetical protein IPK83_01700 [Planctomycetes bacterium]|nr:hypothetical protein [Planctomycetota bacterium]